MTYGGTIAAIAGKDFVLVGVTHGAALGRSFMISRRGAKRMFKLYDRILVAYTGLYGGFQHVNSMLETYLKADYYKYKIVPTVKRVSSTLSAILYSDRFKFPNPIEAIVAGFNPDRSGPELYVVGSLGELIPEKYAATGDGFEIALAVLESQYKEDLSLEEAKKILYSALKTAAARVMTNDPYLEPEVDYVKRPRDNFTFSEAFSFRLLVL